MKSVRSRLPSRSNAAVIFGIVSFPVFAWANVQLLREVPSWLLHLRPTEMIGGAAYIEVFALLESMLLFVGVTAFVALLPPSWVKDRRVELAFIITIVVSISAIAIHYTAQMLRHWGWPGVAGVSLAILSISVLGQYLALRSDRLCEIIHEIVERVVLLSYLYVGAGVLGLILIAARNIL